MNSTELASLLFPFDPNADRIVFYATTIAYSLTAMWNVITISYIDCLKNVYSSVVLNTL